jgi:transposase
MSDTGDLHISKPGETAARRVEVFTGAGRRRTWSREEKAAIVAESFGGADTVSAVARRHGLTAPQLFAWRREADRRLTGGDEEALRFVPAVLEPSPEPARGNRQPKYPSRSRDTAGIVEIELDGVTVRVGRGAEGKTIAAVIRALKGGA